MKIVLGTRGSKLALTQSNWVAQQLRKGLQGSQVPQLEVELKVIKTTGDKFLGNLEEVGGKGVFVKEIEEALLSGEIDLAVHSLKDMPAEFPQGLSLIAVPKREDPRDVFISYKYKSLDELPQGATLGTSAPRRKIQMKLLRPDLAIVPVRGNVDTRLGKLKNGEFDAIVLAAAGMHRLGLHDKINEYLAPEKIIPAIGQGVLALEARSDNAAVIKVVKQIIHDEDTSNVVAAERALLQAIGGDCHTPVGVHSKLDGNALHLQAFLASEDGAAYVVQQQSGSVSEAAMLGTKLGKSLRENISA